MSVWVPPTPGSAAAAAHLTREGCRAELLLLARRLPSALLTALAAAADAAAYSAATAAAGTCVETLGGKVKVEKDAEGNLTFGGAKIVKTDIKGSNGTIHVIDGVVTAPSEGC
mgnify:CR=1 FL=1